MTPHYGKARAYRTAPPLMPGKIENLTLLRPDPLQMTSWIFSQYYRKSRKMFSPRQAPFVSFLGCDVTVHGIRRIFREFSALLLTRTNQETAVFACTHRRRSLGARLRLVNLGKHRGFFLEQLHKLRLQTV